MAASTTSGRGALRAAMNTMRDPVRALSRVAHTTEKTARQRSTRVKHVSPLVSKGNSAKLPYEPRAQRSPEDEFTSIALKAANKAATRAMAASPGSMENVVSPAVRAFLSPKENFGDNAKGGNSSGAAKVREARRLAMVAAEQEFIAAYHSISKNPIAIREFAISLRKLADAVFAARGSIGSVPSVMECHLFDPESPFLGTLAVKPSPEALEAARVALKSSGGVETDSPSAELDTTEYNLNASSGSLIFGGYAGDKSNSNGAVTPAAVWELAVRHEIAAASASILMSYMRLSTGLKAAHAQIMPLRHAYLTHNITAEDAARDSVPEALILDGARWPKAVQNAAAILQANCASEGPAIPASRHPVDLNKLSMGLSTLRSLYSFTNSHVRAYGQAEQALVESMSFADWERARFISICCQCMQHGGVVNRIFAIYNMGKVGAQWDELDSETQELCKSAIHAAAKERVGAFRVGSEVFTGLSLMGFWVPEQDPELISALRTILLDSMGEPPVSTDGLAFLLEHISATGWTWRSLGHELTDLIERRLVELMPLMSRFPASSALKALGTMNARFVNFSPDLKNVVRHSVAQIPSSISGDAMYTPEQVAMAAPQVDGGALAFSPDKPDSKSVTLAAAKAASVPKGLHSLEFITATLYFEALASLGFAEVNWDCEGSWGRRFVSRAIKQSSVEKQFLLSARCLRSAAQIGLRAEHLPPSELLAFQRSAMKELRKVATRDGMENNGSVTIEALGRLRYSKSLIWDNDKKSRRMFQKGDDEAHQDGHVIPSVLGRILNENTTPENVVSIFTGLAGLDVTWNDLSRDIRHRLTGVFEEISTELSPAQRANLSARLQNMRVPSSMIAPLTAGLPRRE